MELRILSELAEEQVSLYRVIILNQNRLFLFFFLIFLILTLKIRTDFWCTLVDFYILTLKVNVQSLLMSMIISVGMYLPLRFMETLTPRSTAFILFSQETVSCTRLLHICFPARLRVCL